MTATPIGNQPAKEDKAVVNELMKELKSICVAWQNNFKDQDAYNRMRATWLKALIENGIDSLEKLECGLRIARREASAYWPAPGDFIRWCEVGIVEQKRIPDQYEINKLLHSFKQGREKTMDRFTYWVWRNMDVKRFFESNAMQSEKHLSDIYKKLIRLALQGHYFREYPQVIEKPKTSKSCDYENGAQRMQALREGIS